MRCGTIGSCQSAATSEIVKALLVTSLTHVSGAVTSVQTFTFISNTIDSFSPLDTHHSSSLRRSMTEAGKGGGVGHDPRIGRYSVCL